MPSPVTARTHGGTVKPINNKKTPQPPQRKEAKKTTANWKRIEPSGAMSKANQGDICKPKEPVKKDKSKPKTKQEQTVKGQAPVKPLMEDDKTQKSMLQNEIAGLNYGKYDGLDTYSDPNDVYLKNMASARRYAIDNPVNPSEMPARVAANEIYSEDKDGNGKFDTIYSVSRSRHPVPGYDLQACEPIIMPKLDLQAYDAHIKLISGCVSSIAIKGDTAPAAIPSWMEYGEHEIVLDPDVPEEQQHSLFIWNPFEPKVKYYPTTLE